MIPRVAEEPSPEPLLAHPYVYAEGFREKIRRHAALGDFFDLRPRVQADHLPLIDSPLEPEDGAHGPGRAFFQTGAVENNGVVDRKMAQIVLEDFQIVVGDVGVGRVEIDHLDAPAVERPVGEVVIEPADEPLGESVAVPEAGPPVAAVHEFVRESEFEVREPAEVRDGGDAEFLGHLFFHAHRVGVVEPEGAAHADAHFFQGRSDRGNFPQTPAGENLLRDGPGVFGIGVDFTCPQRVPEDARAAELAAVPGAGAGVADEMGEGLAQDDGLGEFF